MSDIERHGGGGMYAPALSGKTKREIARLRSRNEVELSKVDGLGVVTGERLSSVREATLQAMREQWWISNALAFVSANEPLGIEKYAQTAVIGSQLLNEVLIAHGKELLR